jgi:GGDEF domain-containing protein
VQKNTSIARLQQIEKQIEQASMVEDLRSLKTSLGDCLTAVRDASASQQKQSAETIQLMERQISQARLRSPERRPESPETYRLGLKTESKSKPAEYMVVFLLDRENSIAARFGEDVRQSILRFLQQRLKEALLPSDRIVRWKGAAFLASVKRTGTLIGVRAELSNVANIQVPPSIEIGNRSIRLPISLSWAIFPQTGFPSLDRLFEKVDEFIARTQSGVNS